MGRELVGGAESGSIREERNMPAIIRPRIGSTPLRAGIIFTAGSRGDAPAAAIRVGICTAQCSIRTIWQTIFP